MGKIYAVKNGRRIGKFLSWADCEKSVKGFKGAEFKSFSSEEEANEYLGISNDKKSVVPGLEDAKKKRDILCVKRDFDVSDESFIAFVDGSYDSSINTYGYGVVLFSDSDRLEFNGCDCVPYLSSMHNISGELLGAMVAVLEAEKLGCKKLLIVHDLEGIGKWVDKEHPWKANKTGTMEYQEFIRRHRSKIDIDFKWVKGHTGVTFNELADKLASEAISKDLKVNSVEVFNL